MDIFRLNSDFQIKKPNPNPLGNDFSKFQINETKVNKIKLELISILKSFDDYKSDFNFLPIEFHFDKLLAKTQRFKVFLKEKQKNNLIQVDSEYLFDEQGNIRNELKIVYSVSKNDILKTLEIICEVEDFIYKNIKKINLIKLSNDAKEIKDLFYLCEFKEGTKNRIELFLFDILYIKKFNISCFSETKIDSYVKFFKINELDNIVKILSNKGIKLTKENIVSEEEMILNIDINTIEKIRSVFPFLISLASNNKIEFLDDISVSKKLDYSNLETITDDKIRNYINHNRNFINTEVIGVIDSYAKFTDSWNELVEVNNMKLPSPYSADYTHGTQISSLIAANDFFNNVKYKDGLGIFRIKHFGIIPQGSINLTYTIKRIEKIIKENYKKIKIWNLSMEVKNTPLNRGKRISEFGKFLDKLQWKYDVLIIICSGNNNVISYGSDSLLSLTVGSMFYDFNDVPKIASYSGKEKIFNIYEKPNIYDFGNDINEVCTSDKTLWTMDENGFIDIGFDGTSYATSLVTRKCGYLKSKYNWSIQTIKAYINLQKEINIKNNFSPIANVKLEEIEDSNSCIIFYDGIIKPKQTKFEKISVPFKFLKDKKYRNFHYAVSLSYSVNNFLNVGDEYSSLDVTAKIMGSEENGKRKNFLNLEKISNNEAQTQVNLVSNFKKYNPNKVLIDEDLNLEKYKKPYNILDDSIYIEISCNDLFDQVDKEIEYGLVFYLKAMEKSALKDFIKMNVQILEKIEIKIHQEEEIKQRVSIQV